MTNREIRLIEQGSVCYTDYSNPHILTVADAKYSGKSPCPNIPQCNTAGIVCALDCGRQVAAHVARGKSLKSELYEFSKVPFIDEELWNSLDRVNFTRIKGKAKVLRAVEGFARIVLLEDPFESVLPTCEKCEGAKLEHEVYDSIHEGHITCAGSGRTKRRMTLYCPDCDPLPRGGIIHGEPDSEDEIFRRLSRKRDY